MPVLILGLVLFFAPHSVAIVAADWREARIRQWGEPSWKGVYSLLATAGLVLIVWGYALTRGDPVVMYTPPEWLRLPALALMLPVFPLLLAAYLPGRIRRATRHPMLVAIKLWALAHLLVNGMLADVLLFGCFLAWAAADRISLKHRTARPVPGIPVGRWGDALALAGGLVLYGAFVAGLHGWLIGVPLLP